jgi:hypothetical protein
MGTWSLRRRRSSRSASEPRGAHHAIKIFRRSISNRPRPTWRDMAALIVLTALAMVPGGAHLFAMLNKLPMSPRIISPRTDLSRLGPVRDPAVRRDRGQSRAGHGAMAARRAGVAGLRGGRADHRDARDLLHLDLPGPTRRRRTGPRCRKTGRPCAGSGNIRTRSMRC